MTWFRARFPRVLIFAIPNGGFRSISVAKRLKAEGVVAGVPDLYVPEWHLFIEMKRTKNGRLSKVQLDIAEQLQHIGCDIIVGYGATDASRKLLTYLQKITPT